MRITMTGSGYVGLVPGACFADFGDDVICIDKDQRRVDALQEGRMPIFEPGLDELVSRNVKAARLTFGSPAEAEAAGFSCAGIGR